MRTHSTRSFNKLLRNLKNSTPKQTAYSIELQNPMWKAKRLEILARDKNSCQLCMATTGLQIHHKKYLPNRHPWEYSNDYLITLCFNCHKRHHRKAIVKKKVVKK